LLWFSWLWLIGAIETCIFDPFSRMLIGVKNGIIDGLISHTILSNDLSNRVLNSFTCCHTGTFGSKIKIFCEQREFYKICKIPMFAYLTRCRSMSSLIICCQENSAVVNKSWLREFCKIRKIPGFTYLIMCGFHLFFTRC
jgi:hypothetical protein